MLLVNFTIFTAFGILGGYYLDHLSGSSIKLLRENYKTLHYTREMSLALHEITMVFSIKDAAPSYRRIKLRQAFEKFELYQEFLSKNIRELGEKDLTEELRADFSRFRETMWELRYEREVPVGVLMQSLNMQDLLEQVYRLNEERIEQTTDEAMNLANTVTLVMIIIGFLFFIFVVVAMFYFPDYIAAPIKELNQSIQQITFKNYNQRLDTSAKDEFGELARSFNTMAEKLDEYESMNVLQLLSEKKRIETIINEMNDPILGLDDEYEILFVNQKWLALTHLEESDVVGRPAMEVARENATMGKMLNGLLQRTDGSGKGKAFPALSLQQNSKTYYYEQDLLRVTDPQMGLNGTQTTDGNGWVVILRNVTEFKEKDLAKTNFMATLSHELKTPLSAIDMSLGLLKDERIGPLNEEQKDLAQTIQHNAARILNMVNEILDISRIETGNVSLNPEPVQPIEIVEKAITSTKTFTEEKQIKVLIKMEEDLPELMIDKEKTTGVLINFLTNAIRYSQKQDPLIVAVRRKGRRVEFSVTDQGPGISREEQGKIFARYRRVKDDKTKGTGLGLAISKEFVEAQGGKIWVKSKLGVGSTFGFELPMV